MNWRKGYSRIIGFLSDEAVVWFYYYHLHRRDDKALTMRLIELSNIRVRYGVQRLHILLRREGWKDNHKRIYRIYCEEGLNLRRNRNNE